MNVTKRDGSKDVLDPSKIRKHLMYACKNLEGTIASEVEINAVIQFEENISTSHIQDILIQSALSLIDTNSNYSIVAGRLYLQSLRRSVYGKGWTPPTIRQHLENNIYNNIYTDSLLLYTRDEFELLEEVIDHTIEENMSYASIKTYTDKYLTSKKSKIYETPQMANMLRFMTAFVNTEDRVNKIIKIYKMYNESKFSLPSPTMKAMRTNSKQYNSCAVVKLEDSLESFDAINGVILSLSSKMYGLGLDGGKIRRLGAPVRNGEIEHTGSTKFIQMFEKTLNSCSQGGMRKGSLTYYYPIWHYDVEDLIMLRDHGGMDENRCRTLMYSIQNHGLFWELFLKKKDITLFSPENVPDLYEYFFSDSDKFKELYFKYVADDTIQKRTINSVELFSLIATQMYQTGKLFLANVDLMNQQTPFLEDTIYSSNLCCEISLPSLPIIKSKNDPDGLISLCTLAAVNWQAHSSPSDLESTMELLVEFMNEGLHDQPAYLKPAENSTKWFAPLGIGITNLAHFMADKGLRYGDVDDNSVIHEWAEATYYYALKGSMLYAKNNPDRIPSKIHNISHANGKYVFENFKGMINHPEICSDWSLKQDWDYLTYEVSKYSLANATVLAMMPGETSSIIQNLTNSLEPISFNKSSKSGNLKYFPPKYNELKDNYQRIFEVSNEDYLKTACMIQRFNDQAISLNLYFVRDDNDKQSLSEILDSILYSYTLGLKTIYYTKNKGNDDSYYDITNEDDCDSCKL
jgi:ribonucleoside-diphosphate reductase alpha chain